MANTVTQGDKFTDTAGRTGIVNFDPNTGKPLSQGQTVNAPTLAYSSSPGNAPGSWTNGGGDTPVPVNPAIFGGQTALSPNDQAMYLKNNPSTPAPATNSPTGISGNPIKSVVNKYGSHDIGYFPTYQQALQALTPKQASAPTNLNQVTPSTGTFTIPSATPSSGDISLAVGANTGISTQNGLEINAINQANAADEAQKTATQNQTYLQKLLQNNQQNTAQIRQDATEKYAIAAKTEEINSLKNQYNQLVAARDAQIAATGDKLGSMNFINNQVQEITRNAAPQLAALSADINLKTAIITQDQALVQQAVSDATADQKTRFDTINTMIQMNENLISRMDSRYQNSMNNALQLARDNWQQAVADKKQVAELATTNPKAGITMADDLETAMQKFQSAGGDPLRNAQIANERRLASGVGTGSGTSTPTGGYKFTSTQLNNGAQNSGLSITDFKNIPADVQNFYINASKTQMDSIKTALASPDAATTINSSNLTQQAKDYFMGKIVTPAPTSGGSWSFGSLLEGIKNFFSRPK